MALESILNIPSICHIPLSFLYSDCVVEHIKHKFNSIIVYIQIVINRVYARIKIVKGEKCYFTKFP